MGEAKRRGTFEQRKALAIKRNAKTVPTETTKRQIISPRAFLPVFYGVGVAYSDMMRGKYYKKRG